MEKPVYRKQRHSSYLENSLEERAVQLARYMVENNATVRQTATIFGVSKSTVHKDLCDIIILIKGNTYRLGVSLDWFWFCSKNKT